MSKSMQDLKGMTFLKKRHKKLDKLNYELETIQEKLILGGDLIEL
ncbi:hypothetical protein [Bacillus pretiosus]